MSDALPPDQALYDTVHESRDLVIRLRPSTLKDISVRPNASGAGIFITSAPYRQATAEEIAAANAAFQACWQAISNLDPDSRAWVLRAVRDRSNFEDTQK